MGFCPEHKEDANNNTETDFSLLSVCRKCVGNDYDFAFYRSSLSPNCSCTCYNADRVDFTVICEMSGK